MAAIGVHLGCTSACVAVYKDGRADVVANDAGDRVTPAIVAYSKNEEVVGLAAKQSRIRNISNTVMKVKQILGRRNPCKIGRADFIPPHFWIRKSKHAEVTVSLNQFSGVNSTGLWSRTPNS